MLVSDELWRTIQALDGQEIPTLRDGQPFIVKRGTPTQLSVTVPSGRSYPVRRLDVERVLSLGLPIEQLRPGLVRQRLEAQGHQISCASYVSAILQELHRRGVL
jgi:hypothetical protein